MLTANDIELTLDEEFTGLVPRHTDAEAEEFRKNVEIPGRFNYPILYWHCKGQNLIVDGRHRFELWCSLPENTPIPPPEVKEVLYPDRAAVRQAIIRDRIGRSNCDPQHRKLLIGKLYNEEKASVAETHENIKKPAESSGGHNGPPRADTAAKRVAAETNTPARTVKRYGAYAEALDVIGAVNGKAKSDIEAGKLKVPQKDVIAISKLERPNVGKALGNIRNGRKWNDGIQTTNGKAPANKRTTKKKPDSPLKPISTASGALSRALAKAGEKHGQGTHYKAIFAALTTINEAVSKWEASCA